MKRIRRFILTALALVAIVAMAVPGSILAQGPEEFATGLNEPTPEQAQWMKQNFPVIQKIRLNQVAFERINADREARGMTPLPASQMDLAPLGREAVFAPGRNDVETTAVSAGLSAVDNSSSAYFPPIGDQGSIGSCVAWATTYYQLSYETNLALGGSSNIFSPKWTYNMINGGVDGGSYFADAYNLELKNGAASYAQFPYDTNYRAWDMDSSDWKDAINYRPQTMGSLYNSNVDAMINTIKTTLADGHVMVIGTYVYSWVMSRVSDDPSTSADDGFAGQYIASYEKNTRQGGHGMTIVGYNDDIWCDLNGNHIVDAGEKGAFKIANSWGNYWNAGFVWITYDSLRTTSAVSGWSSSRNSGGIFYSGSVWILTVGQYAPSMKAEVTLNQAKRGQVAVTLGIGPTSSTTPAHTWTSEAVYNSGGNYAFDGTTAAVDGTFFFDFNDLAAYSDADGTNRWFMGIRDSRSGSVTTIQSFKLYEGDTAVAEASGLPQTVDGRQVYFWVDYPTAAPGNQAPVAYPQNIMMDEDTPVAITLAGSDPDGDPLTYSIAAPPSDGVLSGTAPDVIYTPASGFTGSDSFTFTANDGQLTSTPATVSITVRVPVTASFSISASPGARNVKRGSSASYTVTLTSTGGYVSPVKLTADGPADIVIGFSSDEVVPTGTCVMTVTTSSSTPKDTYTLTINGTGGEVRQSTTVSLKVR